MNWIDKYVGKSKAAKYIVWAGELEFVSATETDSSGRRVKFRIVRAPEELGKVNPFAQCTRRRRGHAGSRFEVGYAGVANGKEFLAEMVLLNWSDDPRGSTVTLAMNNEAATHPFMHDTRASKESAGTRYMASFIEKNDDDTTIRQDKVARLEAAKTTGRHQTLSNVARILTKNERFWDWIGENAGKRPDKPEAADAWLKKKIKIKSKAELDDERTPESVDKIAKFHRLRNAFVDWQMAQGDDILDR